MYRKKKILYFILQLNIDVDTGEAGKGGVEIKKGGGGEGRGGGGLAGWVCPTNNHLVYIVVRTSQLFGVMSPPKFYFMTILLMI